jgi:hypothetical protein
MTTEASKQRLLSWQSEITAELEEAKKTLPSLETAHEAAIAAACDVSTAYRDLQHRLGPIGRLAGPLSLRSNWYQNEVTEAKGRQDRARVDLDGARAGVSELERALAQIDRLLTEEVAA